MIWLLYIALPFMAALANPLRGGWQGDEIRKFYRYWGVQQGRALMAATIGLPTLAYGWEAYGVFIALTWAAQTFPWGPWMNCYNWRETLVMSMIGLLITAPSGLLAFFWRHDDLGLVWAVSGAAMGLCYRAGRGMGEQFGSMMPKIFGDRITYSEACFGYWLGYAAAAYGVLSLVASR